jgi:hypothetical protein
MRLRVVADLIAVARHAPQDLGVTQHGAPDDEKRRLHVLVLEHVEQLRRRLAIGPIVERQRDDMPRTVDERAAEDLRCGRFDRFVQGKESGAGDDRGHGQPQSAVHERSSFARADATVRWNAGDPNDTKSATILA